MDELEGRVAVITGGASGIGLAMAERFRAEGMHVVLADIEAAALDPACTKLGAGQPARGSGGDVSGIVADVSDPDAVQRLADAVFARYNAVHVLCLNAGVGGGGRAVDLTLQDWQWVVGVNLWGVVHGLQAFVRRMVDSGQPGHVVLTASMAGLMAYPNIPMPYNATKYAVVGIAETLRDELLDTDVRVSVLCPGFVRTNIRESQRNRPAHLRNEQPSPSGRAMNAAIRENAAPAGVVVPWIEAGDVADQVLDAIGHDRFWIVTHPSVRPLLDARHDALVADLEAGARRTDT